MIEQRMRLLEHLLARARGKDTTEAKTTVRRAEDELAFLAELKKHLRSKEANHKLDKHISALELRDIVLTIHDSLLDLDDVVFCLDEEWEGDESDDN